MKRRTAGRPSTVFVVESWVPSPTAGNTTSERFHHLQFQSLDAARKYAAALMSNREWTIQQVTTHTLDHSRGAAAIGANCMVERQGQFNGWAYSDNDS